jgi:hypothetical protein
MSRTRRSVRRRQESRKELQEQVKRLEEFENAGIQREIVLHRRFLESIDRDLEQQDLLFPYVSDDFTGAEDLASRWAAWVTDYERDNLLLPID